MTKGLGFYRMNDGRCFTDYRNSHEVDNELKKLVCEIDKNNKCCAKNDQYKFKLCITNNSLNLRDKIIKFMNK